MPVERRKPEYLSPTSMSLFYDDPATFYQRYLIVNKAPREPQTQPMSVGSAFDAYIKSYLFKRLVGRNDENHSFEKLFETQVEPHNRDQARIDGKEVFDYYIKHGAAADLILDMEGCISEPRFETTIMGFVGRSSKIGSVPLLGKPDIFFITKSGARIIFDWKVNGFYSKTPASPKGGYVTMFPGRMMHKDCLPNDHRGFRINTLKPINKVDPSWAAQCSTYAWVLGEDVGSDFIVVIDQIACNSTTRQHRIARHSAIVQPSFQNETYDKYHKCWEAINNDHIFLNMSFEESQAKCRTIDKLMETNVDYDPTFDSLTNVGKKRWR